MRIQPTPTPIAVSAVLERPEQQPDLPTPKAHAAPRTDGQPLVIDMGGTRIELQPGELAKVVDKLNEAAHMFSHTLKFKIAEGGRVQVKVIDTASGEIIREIPPDKAVEAFSRMQDLIGLLFDRKA